MAYEYWKQPNSVLNPKPGINSPQGNALPSFITPQDMQLGGDIYKRPNEATMGENVAGTQQAQPVYPVPNQPQNYPTATVQPFQPIVKQQTTAPAPAPNMTPGSAGMPSQLGPSNVPPLQKVFDFLKGDLERERDLALDTSKVGAAARGVYYGSPGMLEERDINERFLRGLGGLEASLLQSEQENELRRLGMAIGLIPQDIESSGGIDPAVFQALAPLLMGQQQPAQNPLTMFPQLFGPYQPNVGQTPGGLKPPTPLPKKS